MDIGLEGEDNVIDWPGAFGFDPEDTNEDPAETIDVTNEDTMEDPAAEEGEADFGGAISGEFSVP
jgi:hypothetical protein